MVRLIRVVSNSGSTRTTVYEGEDGNTYTLQGDLGVRANNPGNISPSVGGRSFWANNFGAIGFVPSSPGEPYVAIFPDAASGAAAQRYLWGTEAYQNLTIAQAARRWASDAYPAALAAAAGVPASTLVRDLTPAQMDAMYAAQRAAEGAPRLTVLDAQGNRLDPAIITGGHPVPPGLMGANAPDRLAAIQDREAGRLGFGELPPQPLSRPTSFNETGAPPVPLTRPNSFNETGAPPIPLPRPGSGAPRITDSGSLLAALNGLTSNAAMSVTPRLPDGLDLGGAGAATFQPLPNSGRTNYAPASVPMDQSAVQARATILDEGVGSLLNPSSPSPSALNPGQDLEMLRQLVSPVVAGRPDAPIGTLPAARTGTMITGRPDAPIGTLPAAQQPTGDARDRPALRAPQSPASGPAAGRPGGATEIPMDGGRIDNGSRPTSSRPQAVPRAQETARLANGTSVVVGQSYRVGNRLMIAEPTGNGGAVLRDVNDVRDQFLRDHVDQNAPLLFENSVVGNFARTAAAPMIRSQIEQAGNTARDAAGNLISGAVSTVGGLANQARDALGNLFAPRASAPVTSANANLNLARNEQASQRPAPIPPVSSNANLNSARSEQATLRSTSSSSPSLGNTLSAPGAGLTPAQRTAMATVPLSADVRPLATPQPASTAPRTTTTTITNPAYTEWQQRYGDGSQVQTAATGGNITRNQLAAIQNVAGAVQAPIVRAPPPPPPRTITVTRTVAAPAQTAAAAPPMPRPSPIVSIGGFLYDSSQRTPTGAMLRLGRVGAPTGNTLTVAPRASAPLTGTARVAASLGLNPGSVAATEAWHGSGETPGGPAGGYAMGA